jgi:hypothetical protein
VPLLIATLRALGDAGEPEAANRLAGRVWAVLRRADPAAAQKVNGLMHRLARQEDDITNGQEQAMPSQDRVPTGADSLAAALEHEHREIDAGIEAYLAGDDAGALTRAMQALRRHIFLEEEFLFPPLREAGLVAPIFVMLREHGEIWDTLDAAEARLAGGSAAPVCRELLEQLDRHNSKEEPIIYPQADTALSGPASAGLRAFLASGRMPEGWVCARAGAAT